MNILFDKAPGEIYDVFSSLWILNNYEYAKEEMRQIGVEFNKNYENILLSLKSNGEIDKNKIERYFQEDLNIAKIFLQLDMWKYNNLNEYLNFLMSLNDNEIRERIVKAVADEDENKNDLEEVYASNESIMNYIKHKEINSSLKWEIFCLLDDRKKYMEDFVGFIKEYSKISKEVESVRNKEVAEFNLELQKKLQNFGLEYLRNITKNIIDFEDFENIYISSSICNLLFIQVNEKENTCCVLIGTEIKKYLEKNGGSNTLENNLKIFKNISDKTRFSIIKLLLEKDYYGQEIAKVLNITTATVSYHMNFLVLTELVHIERKEHKAYYSLNKNVLRNCIKFLNNEFKL
ncbi:ArsR/SmtB family transcription factor [Oceanirhabdus sp. W0125-5]|uniref:ArsR/SmtB family transcription factor n=1 Tax=Oceanirhabdus sp. W0125-5 TaxID=2999116 RepID=UPI0022F2F8F1|nr:ArsR family transcriptional regulator [Oceanirhabdus sp. W0125-5]WBW97125.1 ArsR family transcriptional regulator [Oceanirhabdus sp. W0125-5]